MTYAPTCTTPGCERPCKAKRDGGYSRYCRDHAAVARAAWLENIETSKRERDDRYAVFAEAFTAAKAAAKAAGDGHTPTPMVVQEHENPLNDASPVVNEWHVEGGVCGFAWVKIRPGNSSVARYAVAREGFSRAYGGGVDLWIHGYGQSMERKEAYADAYAQTLRNRLIAAGIAVGRGGVEVYADSRMD